MLRALLDVGPVHHRGTNYILLRLLGRVLERLGRVPTPPVDTEAFPIPLRLPARVLEQIVPRGSRELYAGRLDSTDLASFLPAAGVLGILLLLWTLVPVSSGIAADLLCWLGVALLLLLNTQLGERLVHTRVDMEAVLFLLSLFVLVAAVRRTGLFAEIARQLLSLPITPLLQLGLFLILAGLLTGIFSAGPSMAALLEVANALAQRLPRHAVNLGLALSVCAGGSLLLTAATSGPMAQALTKRADLRDAKGRSVRFGFFEFLPADLLSFVLIQLIALGYAAWSIR